ncbi:MAG: acyltransferase, partial [Candidatus Latescibacteria bacterium]|nr:acyltransferase [Candidatus Latescibacterota bacterium]
MLTGFLQFRPVFGDVAGNLDTMIDLVSSTDADLLVLPELATTGYAFTSKAELMDIAEPARNSPSLDRLAALASDTNCALVVGFAERADGRLFNSAALLTPAGGRTVYRKLHLFGSENFFFTPGDRSFTVQKVKGARVGMMICFDWFFPESARVLALAGAQVICHPVNFVLPWGQQGMMIASVQNRVFTVTANRYGSESRGEYSFTFTGGSQVVSPGGVVLAQAQKEGDSLVVVDIDPLEASNKNINRHNNVFRKRRTEF